MKCKTIVFLLKFRQNTRISSCSIHLTLWFNFVLLILNSFSSLNRVFFSNVFLKYQVFSLSLKPLSQKCIFTLIAKTWIRADWFHLFWFYSQVQVQVSSKPKKILDNTHWFHFSPMCVFKWFLNLSAREDA